MPTPKSETEVALTVMLTVVSGKQAIQENLKVLCPQIDFEHAEIIVPFDKWSSDVGELASEFPEVNFHFIDELGLAASEKISSHQHRLYDRRRAVGLQLARGNVIAMIEDHGRPADDWVSQMLKAHEQPFEVIGGAIENAEDRPLNWALYYCDFGRYGRPFKTGEVSYVSDVNLAYKRDALMVVNDIWRDAYHETTVHWTLLSQGKKLCLDDRPVVYQKRKGLKLFRTLSERIAWGRVFAETRVNELGFIRRLFFAASSPLLPPLLLFRVFRHMRRQKQTPGRMILTLPIAFLLLIGWSFGESIGYFIGEPKPVSNGLKTVRPSDSCSL
jgi:hypothetical protein